MTRTNEVTVPGRRRLRDLFVVGKLVTVDDSTGDPIEIWVQKLTPYEAKQSVDRSNAARAKVRALRFKDEDDLRATIAGDEDLDGFFDSRDAMINMLNATKLSEERQSTEAELAEQEEWSKDGYLEGLREQWTPKMEARYLVDDTDAEANAIHDELDRFRLLVEEKMAGTRTALARKYDDQSDEELMKLTIDQMIDLQADDAWVLEFRRQEMYCSVRDPEDHDGYYFESADEVDFLAGETRRRITQEIDSLSVDPSEGKD